LDRGRFSMFSRHRSPGVFACPWLRPLAVAGLAVMATAPALAADTIDEIVVTVRQRAESVKDVPGSVDVLTSKAIEDAGVERARDFIALTPGVSIVNAAEVADSQVNIRGINGARDAETNYALVIDGILMTNPAALNREYTNLQQIEVLKGPQGAIYGRNAAAGAFVITTKKPGDTLSGNVQASAAQDDTYVLLRQRRRPAQRLAALEPRGRLPRQQRLLQEQATPATPTRASTTRIPAAMTAWTSSRAGTSPGA
ncbi:MAG: Plug domain-containing protein, partial [Gammaproteobacteria bacterium]|nr:Plug domain-containing protein [Gammaproteobacteria bacterium]